MRDKPPALKHPKPGKQLEALVAALERALSGTDAEIEAPSRRLTDRDTGRAREHDVLITWDHGHHQIITAVECRDQTRPVGVPAVEAFADKCAATGVHSGVIVSAAGFTKTAKQKAQRRSITCMDFSEVERFDWLATEAFVGYERRFGQVEATIVFQSEGPTEIAAIYDINGTEVGEQGLIQTVIQNVPMAEDAELEVGKTLPVRMRINTIDWTVRDREGKIWPVSHILATTSFATFKTVHTFRTHSYSGGGKTYEIAVADAQFTDLAGKFVVIRNEDETMSVVWAPDESRPNRSTLCAIVAPVGP